MSTGPTPSPRTIACPPSPDGCGAVAGAPCTSHGGTRERRDFHRARTAALEAARIATVPAAKLVADAVKDRTIVSGTRAAALLAEHGYSAEADRVQNEVRARNGLMSAKQAVAFLIGNAGGEGQ
ncbi:zinc finger domain-containing protein [Streptomyces sp. 3214.6]|uniref:zinc finger domain-containing protein n=1 Tax=Streptomyces sp. 3214.6 TaxID=1882757 RepID=UPI000909FE71|nr:hypothetical protein [Streptomyces sp. 3214.6]SHI67043.1 hypothetical protein SAMN05444521_8192 [Streptomyces sp. 3214.6]